MSEHEKIMALVRRYGMLSAKPRVIFVKIMKRLGIMYTEYSRALGKYPEYLNNRMNKSGSRPIGLNDLFELKDVVKLLMPDLKFSDILEEALIDLEVKNLTGIALHKYYQYRIEELEKEVEKNK